MTLDSHLPDARRARLQKKTIKHTFSCGSIRRTPFGQLRLRAPYYGLAGTALPGQGPAGRKPSKERSTPVIVKPVFGARIDRVVVTLDPHPPDARRARL